MISNSVNTFLESYKGDWKKCLHYYESTYIRKSELLLQRPPGRPPKHRGICARQWFGFALWHMNHYRSLNAKSYIFKYIYINIYMICQHKSKKLNHFNYCYVSLTIQSNISHLFTHSWMIKQFYFKQFNLAYKSFVCTQFKCQTVLFDP